MKKESRKYHEANKEHINKYKTAHMIGVAEYMRNNAHKYDLEPNEMYIVGLLHDIGYLEGRKNHEKIGAAILKKLGICSEIWMAIKYHGTDPNELPPQILDNNVLLLLYEADMQIDAEGHYAGFDGRLNDIKRRYGKDSVAYKTAYNTINFVINKLKELNLKTYSIKDVSFFDIHDFNILSENFEWKYSDTEDGIIEIKEDGKYVPCPYEMNVSPYIPDEYCCRVFISDKYYYFG